MVRYLYAWTPLVSVGQVSSSICWRSRTLNAWIARAAS
jgi:hypothetical protein